jgi:CBS-domain-containing membrane protein
MAVTNRPFLSLTAEDLMTRAVEAIPQEMSLRAAAHLLSQARISGAPVVDAHGRCVGVLSATDFLHWAEKGGPAPEALPARPGCRHTDWQVMDAESLPQDEVRQYMTADVVTVPPGTRIADLARQMLDAHIHRVIVVDEQRFPVGIVTSTDILAAVAYKAVGSEFPPMTGQFVGTL